MSTKAAGAPRSSADWLMRVCWVIVPLGSLAYQIAAKLLAEGLTGLPLGPVWLAHALLQPLFWALIVSEILGLVAWMYVLANTSISAAFPLSAVSYVLIILASWAVFREPFSLLQLAGGAAILAGVRLLGRPQNPA